MFWLYLLAFLWLTIMGTRHSFDHKHPLWIIMLETGAYVAAAMGLLLYHFGPGHDAVYQNWKWVTAFIFLGLAIGLTYDLQHLDEMETPGLDPEELQQVKTFGILLSLAILLPAVTVNAMLALQ